MIASVAPIYEKTAANKHCKNVIKPNPTTPMVNIETTSAKQRAHHAGIEIKRTRFKADLVEAPRITRVLLPRAVLDKPENTPNPLANPNNIPSKRFIDAAVLLPVEILQVIYKTIPLTSSNNAKILRSIV